MGTAGLTEGRKWVIPSLPSQSPTRSDRTQEVAGSSPASSKGKGPAHAGLLLSGWATPGPHGNRMATFARREMIRKWEPGCCETGTGSRSMARFVASSSSRRVPAAWRARRSSRSRADCPARRSSSSRQPSPARRRAHHAQARLSASLGGLQSSGRWRRRRSHRHLEQEQPAARRKVAPQHHAWARGLVCPRNAYELMTDEDFRPELDGLARHKAMAPIVELRPAIME